MGPGRGHGPPRAAIWLLTALLPGEIQDEVLGDLAEGFHRRVESRGRSYAVFGYWREVLSPSVLTLRRAAMRGREARRKRVHGTGRGGGGGGGMNGLWRDVRYAVRTLGRSRGFAAVVVLTLALGIGANTAVFTVLDSVLLAALRYDAPDRLVRVYQARRDRPDELNNYLTGLHFLEYRAQDDVFDGLASMYTYRELGVDLTGGARPERIRSMPVSSDFFEVLGIPPAMGRAFKRGEERDLNLAVLSHGVWTRVMGADPEAVGETIRLNGEPYTVLGVMPAGFRNPLGGDADVWVPENLDSEASRNSWGNHYLTSIGRLAPGVTLAQAQSRIDGFTAGLEEANPFDNDGWHVQLALLHDDTVGHAEPLLWVLMAAVVLVLLSGCVNVANLYLARTVGRRREMAVRAAMGSSRAALVRQVLTESVLLAVAGGAAGLALAYVGIRALVAASPDGLPRVAELSLDGSVLAFTLTVSLATGLLFGLAPAAHLAMSRLSQTLREGGRGSTGGPSHRRLRSLLIVAEVAVAVVLLAGATVLVRSFQAIQDVGLAIEAEGVLTYEVHLPATRYPTAEDRIAFYDELFPRVRAVPGVRAVGSTSWLPVQGRYHEWTVRRLDTPDDDQEWVGTDVRVVDGQYFEALGIDLVRGRLLGLEDRADASFSMVVNESAAERLFPGEDAVGRMLTVSGPDWTVVGVVEDVPYDPFGAVSRKVYLPHAQFADDRNWAMIQTVAADAPEMAVGPIRAALEAVDPDLVVYRVKPMTEVLGASVSQQRFAMQLMSAFATLALALAALGIYGVVGYLVSQRTHEIGIRMALGAERSQVRRLVVRQGLVPVTLGVVVGIVLSLGAGGWLQALVFEVQANDTWALGGAALVLFVAAGLACYLPARRASRVDPMQAFRAD